MNEPQVCQNCGAELTEEDVIEKFCSNCGAGITFAFDGLGLDMWGNIW